MDASERPRLVVLDAMSLIHRAYHGVPRHFATSTGEPTNAVFGFANILMRIVDELGPDHAAAAFDLPGPTFRDELYEPYKAHRDAPDDALIAQFGRIRQLVEVLGIPIYELESYEADDMLGTLARQAEAEGFDVWLVTGDRDALQLVTPHVRVLSSNPRTGQPLIYDEAAIKKRWGIKPGQVVDFKGLQGDSSDNIPGVKGVGEKTASNLLASYADIDDIYAHLDDIRPAIRRRLEGSGGGGEPVAAAGHDRVRRAGGVRRRAHAAVAGGRAGAAWADAGVAVPQRGRADDVSRNICSG